MDAEAMAFYPILVPVFLAAGYDLLIPVAVIFLGTQIGQLSSVTNPFSTVIASNAAGVSWISGMAERVIMLFVSSAVSIYYIVKYAEKIKENPSASLVYKIDGKVKSPFPFITQQEDNTPLNTKTIFLLLLFALTFIAMITGVIFLDWWLLEMSTVFLASSIIVGIILRLPEKIFIEKFIRGAADLLGVSFIIGVSRGVTIILNEGKISDSIIYYSSQMVAGMPPGLFIVMLLLLYLLFTIFISSTSGMAVVTMPIIGSLAVVIGIQGKDIVNAYLYGMGIMNIISPTGLILPSLALVNVSYKAWLKFVFPLMLILTVICAFVFDCRCIVVMC
jgi:uncharacterized ion transporter superfamily protein YfcC